MGADAVLNTLDQLINPPACTACPFYVRLDGTHYCMFEPCWKSKKAAWLQIEMERASKELGIPIYNREVDGACEDLTSQWSANQESATWFEQRADHLRLKLAYNEYGTNYLTNSKAAGLVSVRKEFQEKKQEEKEQEQKSKEITNYDTLCRQATEAFLHEQIFPHLKEQILGHIHHAGACKLLGDAWYFNDLDMSRATDPAIVDQAKTILLENKIRYLVHQGKGPVMAAKQLQHELLPSWGVKISGDLVQLARPYEVEQEGV
jgi:hypothetical protein